MVVNVAAPPETVEAAVIAPDTFRVLPSMVAPTTSSVLEAEIVVNVEAPPWLIVPETERVPPMIVFPTTSNVLEPEMVPTTWSL